MGLPNDHNYKLQCEERMLYFSIIMQSIDSLALSSIVLSALKTFCQEVGVSYQESYFSQSSMNN